MESANINKHNIEFLRLSCLPNACWDMLKMYALVQLQSQFFFKSFSMQL